jgi:hypothetical protein
MPRSDTPHLHQTVTNPTTIKLEWAQSQRESFEVRTIAVRDYSKGIMQAEPFAKVLCCFKLTGPIREKRDLRECFPCKRENGLLVDSVPNYMILYHIIRIFLVENSAHSTQPGSQPAYIITLGKAPCEVGCMLGTMSESVPRIPHRSYKARSAPPAAIRCDAFLRKDI